MNSNNMVKTICNENHKKCIKCGLYKYIDEFYFRKDSLKYRNECKECFNKYSSKRQYEYLRRPEVIENKKKYFKDYYKRPEVIERVKEYRKLEYVKKSRNNYNKYYNRREYVRLKKIEYNNSNRRKELMNIWNNKNKDKLKEWVRNYNKSKRKNDKIFHIKYRLRSYVNTYIKRRWDCKVKKDMKTSDMLGCSWEYFKDYLENKFKDGMSWDNYGLYGWHIDHIIPLSTANTKEDVYKLFHYSNMQPLWATENIIKSNKIL